MPWERCSEFVANCIRGRVKVAAVSRRRQHNPRKHAVFHRRVKVAAASAAVNTIHENTPCFIGGWKMNRKTLVIHVPHCTTYIPEDVRDKLLLTDEELRQNLLAFTDWYTDELFSLPEAVQVIYPFSRIVCDPERYRGDDEEPMAKTGFGAVYCRDAFLRPLRKVDSETRKHLLKHYDAHHRNLEKAVMSSIDLTGRCLIVDSHSFSARPLPYEPCQEDDRPDICIGTDERLTPKQLEEMAVMHFQNAGFSVSVNYPYSGTMIPLKYCGDSRVSSIMVEVNRGLYLDQGTFRKSDGYQRVKDTIGWFLERL